VAQRDGQFAVMFGEECLRRVVERGMRCAVGRSSVVVESERNSLVQDFVSMLPFHVGLCIGPSGPV
jgi:hypothetical protein